MYRTMSELLMRKINVTFFPTKGIAQALPKRPAETNTVKLMGTIEHEVKRLRNGSIKLYLKTLNEDTSYCIHRVAIANKNLLNMVQKNLAVNQRIYIGGKLKTDNKYVEERIYQDVEILANEIYFLESNKLTAEKDDQNNLPPGQIDENSIEMLAFIGSEVQNEPKFSAFSLVTHFVKNKDTSEQSEGKEFHRVMIYNNGELMQVARHLQKYDKVFATGFINYISKPYPDGVNYTSGFIQPTNLIKLRKYDRE